MLRPGPLRHPRYPDAAGRRHVLGGDITFLLTEGLITMAALATGWSVFTLWKLAGAGDLPVWRHPYFWFFLGTMVYFGGIVPYVGMMRYLYANDPDLTRLLYRIIMVLAIARYLFTSWAGVQARAANDWRDNG